MNWTSKVMNENKNGQIAKIGIGTHQIVYNFVIAMSRLVYGKGASYFRNDDLVITSNLLIERVLFGRKESFSYFSVAI